MTAATKRCNTCGEVLTLDWFYRNRTRPDGHRDECKPCTNEGKGNPGYVWPDLVDQAAVAQAVAGRLTGRLSYAEKREVVRRLRRQGLSLASIARRARIAPSTAWEHAHALTKGAAS